MSTHLFISPLKLLVVLLAFVWSASCISQASQLDAQLISKIESLVQKDQESLQRARELREEFGIQSAESKREDSIGYLIRAANVIELDKILEEHGWPGEEKIGVDGAYSVFSIVQHADKSTRTKYLPVMREAVKSGKCRARYLAGVEDRIATDNNELQVYGDQVKFYPDTETFDVWPIMDPENVDRRRAAIGLEPIATQLKNRFDLDWDL